MAKKKRTRRVRKKASFTKKVRKKAKRGAGDMTLIGGSMIYGAGRQYTSDKLQEVVGNLTGGKIGGMLGSYSDEAIMGYLSYSLMKGELAFLNVPLPKMLRSPLVKSIGRAGVTIESARIGAEIGNRFLGGMTTTKNTSGQLVQTVG